MPQKKRDEIEKSEAEARKTNPVARRVDPQVQEKSRVGMSRSAKFKARLNSKISRSNNTPKT